MNNNNDYLKANVAIGLMKEGMSIEQAVEQTQASISIINVMWHNESINNQANFVDNITKKYRNNICNECDSNQNNTCMECACPIPFITNIKFKECPLGKW